MLGSSVKSPVCVADNKIKTALRIRVFNWFCGRIGYDTTLSRCVIAGSSPVRTANASLAQLVRASDCLVANKQYKN